VLASIPTRQHDRLGIAYAVQLDWTLKTNKVCTFTGCTLSTTGLLHIFTNLRPHPGQHSDPIWENYLHSVLPLVYPGILQTPLEVNNSNYRSRNSNT